MIIVNDDFKIRLMSCGTGKTVIEMQGISME